jgi:hypothetical protein
MQRYLIVLIAMLGVAIAHPMVDSALDPAPPTDPVVDPAIEATWVEQRVDFDYLGITSYYNCDSLRGKLVYMLRLAGARRDVEVSTSGCTFDNTRASSMIHARIHFRSPALTRPASYAGEPTPAPAHWTPVKVVGGKTRNIDRGDCEFLEQFRDRMLRYFEVRNVKSDLSCVPHKATVLGRADLSFEALTPTRTAEEESIEQEKQTKKHDDQLKSERKTPSP